MTTTWNEGYFTESTYTYGYYRELNPVFQNFCLLSRGIAVNSASEAHCELGYGQGITLNLHAAAQDASYYGTDFNPAHAAHAAELARASGADVHIYNDSFAELLERNDLPQFDSIGLHGIWSWVSAENRRIMVDFAAKHLKPGGVLYISYNCYPGWSPAAPLRHLFAMHNRFANVARDTGAQVEAALDFTEKLLAAHPNYTGAVPQLQARFDQIRKQDKHYLAHEYFNSTWDVMYFTDVVDAVASARVDFACTANPLDAVDGVNLADEAVAFLEGIESPIMREQARDYFVNNQFRKDLFVKGIRRLNGPAWLDAMRGMAFVLLCEADAVPREIKGAAGTASLQAEVYEPVLEALASNGHRPRYLADLEATLPQLSMAHLIQAMQILAGGGHVAPVQEASETGRAKCARMNRSLMRRAQYSGEVSYLASPVLGGGLDVGRFEQMFVSALLVDPGASTRDLAATVWAVLTQQEQHLIKEGKELLTEEENLAELDSQANDFVTKRLPILKALEIA